MISRRQVAAGALVLAAVMVAVGAWLMLHPTRPPVSLKTTPIISPGLPTPGPGRPGYRVTSKDLGIDLAVVEGDGWTVPYYKAAHYPGMTWPGEKGRTMLYAHALPGMFAPLATAKVGQHIDVERAGQPTLHYVIKAYFPKWSPGDLTYTRPADHEELVLLTCTSYLANDPRILAVADLV